MTIRQNFKSPFNIMQCHQLSFFSMTKLVPDFLKGLFLLWKYNVHYFGLLNLLLFSPRNYAHPLMSHVSKVTSHFNFFFAFLVLFFSLVKLKVLLKAACGPFS